MTVLRTPLVMGVQPPHAVVCPPECTSSLPASFQTCGYEGLREGSGPPTPPHGPSSQHGWPSSLAPTTGHVSLHGERAAASPDT